MNQNHEEKLQRVYKTIMVIVLTAFITFMITSLTMYTNYTKNPIYSFISGDKNNNTKTGNLNIDSYIKKIRTLIDKNYLWKSDIKEQELKDSAIAGYVKGLGDKYTEYIPASEMEKFKEDILGSYTGIGIYMAVDESSKKIIVLMPIEGSPAEKVGIQSGDIIISVDGVEYGYEDLNIIADKIKGEEGTTVKLVIERDGKQLNYEIKRKKIEINSLTSKMLESSIGYIKLPSFDTDTSKKFKEKADELINKGAKSLIIDLRNNGGGIVDEATAIADYFLDKGKTIMTTKDNKQKEERTLTKEEEKYTIPVVILINENTASASEILTGALKDNERATVIGTKSYGKGVIQTVITLSDGSGLKVTSAEYFTPSGAQINNKGIEPNIETKLPTTIKSIYSVKEDEDTQLKKAIEELKK